MANPSFHRLLVEEIKKLAKEWKGKPISDKIQEHIVQLLCDVSDLLLQDNSVPATWLEQLRAEAIFPIHSSNPKGVWLRTADERFYVADKAQYKDMCEGHLPLLSLGRALLGCVQSLLDSNVFKSRIKYLGAEISSVSICNGPRVSEDGFTEKYIGRLEYIKR